MSCTRFKAFREGLVTRTATAPGSGSEPKETSLGCQKKLPSSAAISSIQVGRCIGTCLGYEYAVVCSSLEVDDAAD